VRTIEVRRDAISRTRAVTEAEPRPADGAVHDRLGGALRHSAVLGATRGGALALDDDLLGPRPELFFVPDQLRDRARRQGFSALDRRFAAALADFATCSGPGSTWSALPARNPSRPPTGSCLTARCPPRPRSSAGCRRAHDATGSVGGMATLCPISLAVKMPKWGRA